MEQKLYKKVADAVAAGIAAGTWRPGERLPTEREFVDQFGVSRLTVREAMLVLEVRGLVEARQGSGVYVVDVPAPDRTVDVEIGAVALTEARSLIEGEAAALAAVEITAAELNELEAILQRMIEENRAERLDAEMADREFHLAIARATHNEAMIEVVTALWAMRDRAPLARAMLQRARQNGMKPTIADHRAIVVALESRNPVAARSAMHNHLHRVIDGLLEATATEAMERARMELRQQRENIRRRKRI